ncbi:hypothetical protein PMAYCL1PPCAC_11731 [Pristionchus mayeri]|uniref:Uncharacterized protein n=1 Tax=Pristionchus mayeri TaxID=1317129 RepID=A0AAN4ZIN5_9BILA|nr:hypothetical protein PMAYCL1PPCAC_11731 [Pristionchus mayeri]
MFGRTTLLASGLAVGRRMVHKGIESTPPLRWIPISEKMALFAAITITFLSYPTSVLLRMNDLRPAEPNVLSEEVQAQIDEIRAARAARK